MARRAPLVNNPFPLTDANLLEGMKTYREACSGCHGDPHAASDYGAGFYRSVPQFAKHPSGLPDYQLFWIIRNGIRYSGMSAWDRQWDSNRKTSDEHIWKAAMFLSRLDTLPPAVDAEWRKQQL